MNTSFQVRRNFDSMGEAIVRDRLARKDFSDHELQIAPLWLREKDDERAKIQTNKIESLHALQASAASRAADAAERANELAERANAAAQRANTIAIIAIIIAAIGAIISIMALL